MFTGKHFKLFGPNVCALVAWKSQRFDGFQTSSFHKSVRLVTSKENASCRPVDHR